MTSPYRIVITANGGSSASIIRGQLVPVDVAVTDATGAAADPTTLKVTVVRPDAQRQTYVYNTDAQVVKDSTGNYHVNLDASVVGTWRVWAHSEGTGQASDEKTFVVEYALGGDAPDPPRSLGTDFFELQRAIGRMTGMGRNNGSWQTNERLDARDIIRSGYRRFLWHPPLTTSSLQGKDGQVQKLKQEPAQVWSFLKKTTTLALVSGTSAYALPDDFGEMIEGAFVFTTNNQSVAIIDYEQILQMQSEASRTGPPVYAALRSLDAKATRYQVVFYPTPDTSYTVTYRYTVAPLDLSEQSPVPLGGPIHAETLLEACLAAAEKYLDDTEGVHEKKFLECLARSIQADKNLLRTDEDPWPLEDAAHGLNINKAYLKRLIGRLLGFGPHQATWDHRELNEVTLALETGLRKFYAPLVLPGERYSHEWSFLKPVVTIITNSESYTYDLPEDFVDLEGPLTFAPDEGIGCPYLDSLPEYGIRQRLANSTSTGRPRYYAKRMKPINPAGGTQYELLLYPPPDGEYPLTFRYQSNPASLANEACLPYGGQQHAQTLIEACLTAAEELGNVVNGPHAAKFLECLMASVSLDRRTGCPESLGTNRDRSDRASVYPAYPGDRPSLYDSESVITYNGISYD